MFAEDTLGLLEGTVQLDETFVGGKNKNRHRDKKVKNSQGRSFKDKTPVMGMLQQEKVEFSERPHKLIVGKTGREKIIKEPARLLCYTVPDTKAESIQPILRSKIKPGANVVSDEWHAYRGLNDTYWHYVVDHSKKQYVMKAGILLML